MKKGNEIPKVSLIIPVYKVERDIERCVRSLFGQTLDDMEYIFVDDCSPDASIGILEEVLCHFQKRKEQIKILRNEKNMGVSYSRLRGLSVAEGEYISFVDSDDWTEYNMYELLYEKARKENYDIVISDYYNEYGGYTTQTTFRQSSAFECLSNLHKKGYFPYTLWCQIYHKHLFDNENINKIQPTNHGEDLWLNICAHLRAKSIGFVPICLYHYNRTNEYSMVKSFGRSKEKWFHQKQNVEMISAFLLDCDCKRMRKAAGWLRFLVKLEYKKAFDDPKEWFYTFRDSHQYIMEYEHLGNRKQLIKIWFIMNFYLCYKLFRMFEK